ncbi:hypothetical protein B9479_002460 [Cryptococcus floricola]|uniref:Uncharacterized protein n=1 Tax=Cryptococcus floricola TaxID=2591691 RepID=A0A5D3B2S1_9TREE|nr:hypothetical protein B9479_002460 [Cryptococcus floricola]
MPSLVTSQIWFAPPNDNGEEKTESVNDICEISAARTFISTHPDGTKRAYVWTCNSVEGESKKNILRGSFTAPSGVNTSAPSGDAADRDEYMTRANEVSTALKESLRDTETHWGPLCRAQGDASVLMQVERSAFDALVETLPERRYGDIGLRTVDRETMRQVIVDSSIGSIVSVGGNDNQEGMKDGNSKR